MRGNDARIGSAAYDAEIFERCRVSEIDRLIATFTADEAAN